MAFVIAATWKAKPGEEERICEVIRLMTPLSRKEPGNLFYQAQVSSRDPAEFFLYEQYTDAQAMKIIRRPGISRRTSRATRFNTWSTARSRHMKRSKAETYTPHCNGV